MHFSTQVLVGALLPVALSAVVPDQLQGINVTNSGVAADTVVPNSFLLVYKDGASDADIAKHHALIQAQTGKPPATIFNVPGFQGVHLEIDAAALAKVAAPGSNSIVKHVELDSKVALNPTTPNNITAPAASVPIKDYLVQQPSATWGLGRISHRLRAYFNYIYDTSACANTRTYIIDTGIRTTHVEFGGRAIWGANFVTGSPNTDQHGHGTHCAGTAVGANVGVCKRGTVVAVKVLNAQGQGYNSAIMAGMQWAYYNAVSLGMRNRAVLSMSLGGGYSLTENLLLTAIVNAGVPVVVAAGNNGLPAKNYSPASAPGAITVGASDFWDDKASFSNYGNLLDIFAPGVTILSAFNTCDNCYWYYDGTSQATPHVAGMVNYLIAKEGWVGPAAIRNRINALATTGKIYAAGAGSPNRLLYNGDGY